MYWFPFRFIFMGWFVKYRWRMNVKLLIKNLFCVNASKSFGPSLQSKSGLLLRMHSISQSIIISSSSWYDLSFVTVFLPLLDRLVRDSHGPPIHWLTGGSNFQTIPQFDVLVFDWFRSWSTFVVLNQHQ